MSWKICGLYYVSRHARKADNRMIEEQKNTVCASMLVEFDTYLPFFYT